MARASGFDAVAMDLIMRDQRDRLAANKLMMKS